MLFRHDRDGTRHVTLNILFRSSRPSRRPTQGQRTRPPGPSRRPPPHPIPIPRPRTPQAAPTSIDVFVFLHASPRYSVVRGLLRTCRKEHPELRIRSLTVNSGRALLPALPLEAQLADGALLERRLHRLRLPPADASHRLGPPADPAPTAPVEVALVTGGVRGVGLRVGAHLLSTGRCKRVFLVGRSPPRPSDAALVASLHGAAVRFADVAEWSAVEALPDAQLVVHCAGAVDDAVLAHTTEARTASLLRPKVSGLIHLRRRYPEARVVAFSSSSALFGVAGQGTYAAANAYLDEACAESIQWGGWGEVGMAVDLGISPLRGERFVSPTAGLAVLDRLLDAPPRDGPRALARGPVLVLDATWAEYRTNGTVFTEADGGMLAPVADADAAADAAEAVATAPPAPAKECGFAATADDGSGHYFGETTRIAGEGKKVILNGMKDDHKSKVAEQFSKSLGLRSG